MPRAQLVLGSLLLVVFAIVSCSQQDSWSTVGPDQAVVLSDRGNGNGGGGGGGGSNTSVTFSLSGGYETDPAFQSAHIVNDNKKRMQIEGGGGCEPAFGCKDLALTFAPDKIGICSPDPVDMPQTTYDELVAQLGDPVQNRTFYASIEKNGAPVSKVESVFHDGGTVDGQKYWTGLSDASAVEGPKDTFTLTGGDVWISKGGDPGGSLHCTFTGAQVLTVVR